MGHNVVDISEERKKKKAAFKSIAGELTSELTTARGNLLKSKERLEEDNRITITMLKERKTQITNLIDKMIKDVTNQTNTSNKKVDEEVGNMDRDLKLINSMSERIARSATSESFTPDVLEGIQQIQERVQRYLLQERAFHFTKDSRHIKGNNLMNLRPEEMAVRLSDTRNLNSCSKNDDGRFTKTTSSTNSRGNRDEDRFTRTTSSNSRGNRDEDRYTRTTSSNSRGNRDEDRFTRTTSSNSRGKRDEDRYTRTTSSNSRGNRDEDRYTRITSSNSRGKRDED